jgi:hypothetical protein
MFNEGRYWQRAQYGDLYWTVEEEGHPSPARSGEPTCTRSQIVAYRDQRGRQVARVHQYRRPDGMLGASGRPDPQLLLENEIVYYVEEFEDGDE